MKPVHEVLTLLANLSVHDLQESSSDDSIDDANFPEMSFDLPLVASTSSKSVPVVDESILSSRSPTPPPPPWSPTTPSNGSPIQQSSPQVAVAASGATTAYSTPIFTYKYTTDTTPATTSTSFPGNYFLERVQNCW